MVEKGRGLVMVAGPSSYWLKGGGSGWKGEGACNSSLFQGMHLKEQSNL